MTAHNTDKKIIDYLPAAIRRAAWFAPFEAGLAWFSTTKGTTLGFGALILVLSSFNYLTGLDNPSHPFWDESYYLTSTQRYVEGTASFASHPPLGFMFMAAGEKLLGHNDAKDSHKLALVKKADKADVPVKHHYFGIRLPGALMAVISCMLFYAIAIYLLKDGFMAFIFSLLLVFENAFIIHFRAAQLDSFQITFVMAALLVWTRIFLRITKTPIRDYAVFGVLIGLSFMVKVNSSVVMALGAISLMRDLWEQRRALSPKLFDLRKIFAPLAFKFSAMMGAFVAAVLLVFALNVALTPNLPDANSPAGKRDLKAMSPAYLAYLKHEAPLTPKVVWHSIHDYSTYMKYDFTGVIKTEPNDQTVLTWPWLTKTVSYRWDYDGKKTAYSLFVGNQFSWRLGFISLLAAAFIIAQRRLFNAKWLKEEENSPRDFDVLEALMAMYLIFMAIHFYLGTQRVMYIYHYFIGLILSYLMAGVVFKIAAQRLSFFKKQKLNLLTALSIAIALSFSLYAPFSYHTPLTRDECEWRNWPSEIIKCMPLKETDKPKIPS